MAAHAPTPMLPQSSVKFTKSTEPTPSRVQPSGWKRVSESFLCKQASHLYFYELSVRKQPSNLVSLRRAKVALLALPHYLALAWLVYWWRAGPTNLRFIAMPDKLVGPISLMDTANFWVFAFIGIIPLLTTVFLVVVQYELRCIAEDVACWCGLSSPDLRASRDAHALMLKEAARLWLLDFAILVPYLGVVLATGYNMFWAGLIYIEGVPQEVLQTLFAVIGIGGSLFSPIFLRSMRLIKMRSCGVDIVPYLDRTVLPVCYRLIFVSCIIFFYALVHISSSPPITLAVASEPLPNGDPCALPASTANTTFDAYPTAQAACDAVHSYFWLRARVQSAIGLWWNGFASNVAIMNAALLKTEPKFPLATLSAQVLKPSSLPLSATECH